MNTRGQSLLEVVMMLPLFIAFWAALLWFSQIFIVSTELMQTARHGVFWLAYHEDLNANPEDEAQTVHNECVSYLKQQNSFIKIDEVQITVQPGDTWHAFGPKTLLDIGWAFNMLLHPVKNLKAAVGLVDFNPASVTVAYNLAAPPLLRIIPGFPQTIPLRGFCVCYR